MFYQILRFSQRAVHVKFRQARRPKSGVRSRAPLRWKCDAGHGQPLYRIKTRSAVTQSSRRDSNGVRSFVSSAGSLRAQLSPEHREPPLIRRRTCVQRLSHPLGPQPAFVKQINLSGLRGLGGCRGEDSGGIDEERDDSWGGFSRRGTFGSVAATQDRASDY